MQVIAFTNHVVDACLLPRPRLGLASRRPDFVAALAGRAFRCTSVLLVLLVARLCGLTTGAPTAGLGFSAPRSRGRAGWPLFPLHLQSSVFMV